MPVIDDLWEPTEAARGLDDGWEIVQGEDEDEEESSRLVAALATEPNATADFVVTLELPHGRDIDLAYIDEFRQKFDSTGRIAQNACTSNSVRSLTISRERLQNSLSPYFSINLDRGGMPATDQKHSGRCWMFGTLNLFRFGTRDKLKLEDFEFSESYLLFYYLLEQTNFFLEFFIDTADLSLDDRLVSNFVNDPVGDGGDWGIAVNLIKKYGLVPKDIYPESFSSGYTGEVDSFLNQMVTNAAFRIRKALKDGLDVNEARRIKWECVAQCHRVLTIHLGTPPTPETTFDWNWRDMDGEFHTLSKYSPLDFVRDYVTVPYQNYVSLIQDPRNEYYFRYQVKYSMPICDGDPINFLNIPANEMKSMALSMLKDGLPVFFACIVENELEEESGLWDGQLYETTELYRVHLVNMSKADRIYYGSGMGDHVMLLTGVDVADDGLPRRWRVENSWGTRGAGDNGYFTMNDNWFDENVFEIVAPPHYLNEAAAQGLDKPVRLLPVWDPMCYPAGKRTSRRSKQGSRC